MPLPRQITFTLEGEPLVVAPPPAPKSEQAPPVEGESAADALPPPPAQMPCFGPEFAGAFVIRMPTIGDIVVMEGRAVAMIERTGVRDPVAMRGRGIAMQIAEAIAFFDSLAVEKPDWCSLEAPGDETVIAILRAHEIAEARIAEAKKKPAGTGG